jgi:hypothetical protein
MKVTDSNRVEENMKELILLTYVKEKNEIERIYKLFLLKMKN